MRSLFLAAALSLTSFVAQPLAEACGGYYERLPTVYGVSTHYLTDGPHDSLHAFITIAHEATVGHATWRPVARHTFDYTQIANAPNLDAPLTMTLVGPSGAKLVSTKRVAFLSMHDGSNPRKVLDIKIDPRSRFAVALPGDQRTAKWIDVEMLDTTDADRAKAKELGLDGDDIYTARLIGTNVTFMTGLRAGADVAVTLALEDGQHVRTLSGGVSGAVVIGGERYAVTGLPQRGEPVQIAKL